jgi:hypothetical protein
MTESEGKTFYAKRLIFGEITPKSSRPKGGIEPRQAALI